MGSDIWRISLNKRNKSKIETVPFGHNENITCYYDLEFGRDVIKPGDKIRFKNTRGYFIFKKWVHNSELDTTWIDCIDPKTHCFKSFHMKEFKGVHRAKKSIRKKLV